MLALKGNQGSLNEDVRLFCSQKRHWLQQKSDWVDLCSIAMIEDTREFNGGGGSARHFFISSLPANARQIA